ncbi:MAG: N-acetylmuramic acid 6-phosphate etherase [Stackebrandtia sp.]
MGDAETVAESLRGLATEGVDPRFSRIDTMPAAEIAAIMNQADAEVPEAIGKELPAVAAAIDAIVERLAGGGRLRYVGAGTAGRMAVVDASECVPTFSTPPDLIKAVLAGGDAAFVSAAEGVEDDRAAGTAAMEEHQIGPGDAVMGVTASGRTPFVLAAVAEARQRGALTVGLSCNRDASLSRIAERPIEVVCGHEVVAGSTRLKAGTAQKMVLNMVSTITMVKLGRTYGNYMVDMSVLNRKLEVRAAKMVSDITGASLDAAREALRRADNHAKTAVLMLERSMDAAAARALLEQTGGRLAEALAVPR